MNKMKKTLFVIAIIMLALVLIQCSKRDNPVDVEPNHGLFWTLYFESSAIRGDVMEDYWFRNILVYTPPGYDAGDSIDYPVLYLLHGYGGSHTYFKGLYDLGDVMDELINSGQIEPMIVATPNATNNLGGSFYTNSDTIADGRSFAGHMQDFITNEVVHIVDSVFNTIPDRAHRGIAGHSMGGYGALKLAMLRNDMFGSAASMSAPLAFWGSNPVSPDFDGILEFLPVMFGENGFNPLDTVIAGDTAAFYRITPGPGKRITNMMFAMGAAFSPHDPADTDTSYSHYFNTGLFDGRIDLPFDVRGQLVDAVWIEWMANDVTSLFALGLGGVFDSTALYVDAGTDDDLVLDIQAQIFAQVAGAALDQFEIYPGVPNLYPASHTGLIHERLKKVVKFHDGAFGQ
jgi:pimeloyl-ACP methyl ester carboxylesterase